MQNILRNVTLKLPEGNELIAGTNVDTIHLYYHLVTVSVVTNIRHINLILSVPLKPSNRYFTLFTIITLPVHISSDRFSQYSIDYTYIGLQHSQKAYTLLTEADFNRCKNGILTICSADIAIFKSQNWHSKLVFFFGQSILTNYDVGNFLLTTRHHSCIATEHCGYITLLHDIRPHCIARISTTRSPRFLHNSSNCYVTSNENQLLPELHGSTQTELDSSQIYIPDYISIATDHEIQQLNNVTPRKIQTLFNLARTPDHNVSRKTNKMFQITSTSLCTPQFLSILCYLVYSPMSNIYCTPSQPNTPLLKVHRKHVKYMNHASYTAKSKDKTR